MSAELYLCSCPVLSTLSVLWCYRSLYSLPTFLIFFTFFYYLSHYFSLKYSSFSICFFFHPLLLQGLTQCGKRLWSSQSTCLSWPWCVFLCGIMTLLVRTSSVSGPLPSTAWCRVRPCKTLGLYASLLTAKYHVKLLFSDRNRAS